MKQAELNKLLNAALKESAKSHNWKFSRGYVFKAAGPLYFTIAILGRANNRYLRYSLSYKWLAFDDVFWTIVESEENRKQPLSFRAAGAWTAPMTRISEGKPTIEDWNADNLAMCVNGIIKRCQLDADKVSKEIHGLDDNLRVIERLHKHHLSQYPKSTANIWMERLFTSILKEEYRDAEKIVRDRLKRRDDGGCQVGSKTFYQLAREYLSKLSETDGP